MKIEPKRIYIDWFYRNFNVTKIPTWITSLIIVSQNIFIHLACIAIALRFMLWQCHKKILLRFARVLCSHFKQWRKIKTCLENIYVFLEKIFLEKNIRKFFQTIFFQSFYSTVTFTELKCVSEHCTSVWVLATSGGRGLHLAL